MTVRIAISVHRSFRSAIAAVAIAYGALAHGAPAADAISPALPPPYRAPYVPASDNEVLQQVPSDSDPAVRDMRLLRRALDSDPSSFAAADRLARAYIDFGRELGDAHYAGYAEAVLAPWLAK